jgi:ER-derived vesicles protein
MEYTRGLPGATAVLFLGGNVVLQVAGSALVLARVRVDVAVAALLAVLVLQALAYGLVTDAAFVLRALSVSGGLLMALSDYWAAHAAATARRGAFPGLPELARGDRAAVLLMAGRVLLVGLVLSLLLGSGPLTVGRGALALVGALLCGMVVVGFRAKATAALLLGILSVANVALNAFWTYGTHTSRRDYAQYDFFQTLSVMGGFLLLANLGPGGLSVDEKKKAF